MTSSVSLNPESENFHQARPIFWIGQHDSARVDALNDDHYEQIRNAGVRTNASLTPPYTTDNDTDVAFVSSLASLLRLLPMSTSTSE